MYPSGMLSSIESGDKQHVYSILWTNYKHFELLGKIVYSYQM